MIDPLVQQRIVRLLQLKGQALGGPLPLLGMVVTVDGAQVFKRLARTGLLAGEESQLYGATGLVTQGPDGAGVFSRVDLNFGWGTNVDPIQDRHRISVLYLRIWASDFADVYMAVQNEVAGGGGNLDYYNQLTGAPFLDGSGRYAVQGGGGNGLVDRFFFTRIGALGSAGTLELNNLVSGTPIIGTDLDDYRPGVNEDFIRIRTHHVNANTAITVAYTAVVRLEPLAV